MGKRVSKEIDDIIIKNYSSLGSFKTWELFKEYSPKWVKKRANILGVKRKTRYKNLIGKTFTRLTVLRIMKRTSTAKVIRWRCACSCGKKVIVYGNNLTSGKSKSCGCLAKENTSKAKLGTSKKIGTKVGRLLILSTGQKFWGKQGFTTYTCLCDCGNIITTSLINCKSCGCLQKDLLIERSKKQLGWASKGQMWCYYRKNAQTRNISWDITKEHFIYLITKPCYYCKVEPWSLIQCKSGDWAILSGVDRKNNNIGYTIENSVPCCKICNRAKLDLELDVFQKWIEAIKKS